MQAISSFFSDDPHPWTKNPSLGHSSVFSLVNYKSLNDRLV